jgi:acetyltransferase-like isoleucine patch superfamily enzyme
MSEYFTFSELKKIGFKKIGKNCKISKKISTYNLIGALGDNVRIDDDVQLKGLVNISSYAHIARGCTLSGGDKGIIIEEFSSLANFVQIFSSSDDYFFPSIPVGSINANLRKEFSNVFQKKIIIGKCCLVGCLSVLLPGTVLGDYSSIGALSVVNKKIKDGFFFQSRSKKILKKRNIFFFKKLHNKIIKEIKKNA